VKDKEENALQRVEQDKDKCEPLGQGEGLGREARQPRSAQEYEETEPSASLGRDSPIVKHYSSIKNSCFVTCVNSALCS
jgi:hypothetical protein